MGLMDFFKKGKEAPVIKPQAQPTRQTPTQNETREYVIKSGDTLSKIAKQYYGNANDWNRIYDANKSVISNPDKIFPGQKIIIPEKK